MRVRQITNTVKLSEIAADARACQEMRDEPGATGLEPVIPTV